MIEEFAQKLSDILTDYTVSIEGGVKVFKDGRGVIMRPHRFEFNDDVIIRIGEFLEKVFVKQR